MKRNNLSSHSVHEPTDQPVDTDKAHDILLAARMLTDPVKLHKIAEDVVTGRILDDGMIASELIENTSLPADMAGRLAKHFRGMVDLGYELCSRHDTSREDLDMWSDHWDLNVISAIVRHPNADEKIVKKLLNSENSQIMLLHFGVLISPRRLSTLLLIMECQARGRLWVASQKPQK